MSTPVTLRVQQQGYVRTTGYQATQWAVTVPIAVPDGAALIGTDPLSFAPLFVLDTAGPFDILRRVATLRDFAELAQAELEYFDIKTSDPDVALAVFTGTNPGDTLRIASPPPHWIQEQAPYTDADFPILGIENRLDGVAPEVFTGRTIKLPGHVFTSDDVGRWVDLNGFATSGNNGLLQILSVLGEVATTSKTFAAPQTGSAWAFPWLHIDHDVGSSVEPRYFPTRASSLAWSVRQGSSVLTSGTRGVTARNASGLLVRSVRMTYLAPSLEAATDAFDYVAAALTALQLSATTNDTAFTALLTRTVGP